MTPVEQIKEQIASLQLALNEANPRMPVLLREIHTHLAKDSNCVTALTEEEISIIVRGLQKQTNTNISASIATKKVSKKTAANLSVDDL